MLIKKMKYKDFEGIEREETFYFNFTKAEIAEMETSTQGGLVKKIERVIETQNHPELIRLFKEIVLSAYGIKSPDGRRFSKSKEIQQEFSETQAYSDLFMELATDAEAAAAFMNAIIPDIPDMADNEPAIQPKAKEFIDKPKD